MMGKQTSPAADRDVIDLFDVDVLVIGASAAGLRAARDATAQGARVLLVERCASLPPPAGSTPEAVPARRSRGLLWLEGHCALELLQDEHGAVRGAAGISSDRAGRRHAPAERPWRAHAAAVVMATGDGLLMAVEAGARLAGLAQGGGLRLQDSSGSTTVAGLYATGRAAWPGSAGSAGSAAAAEAARHGPVPDLPALRPAGRVGLRGPGSQPINPQATCAALQAVLGPVAGTAPDHPLAERTASAALARLDALWQFLRNAAPAPQGALRATREAVARLAMARWQLRSRLAYPASPQPAAPTQRKAPGLVAFAR